MTHKVKMVLIHILLFVLVQIMAISVGYVIRSTGDVGAVTVGTALQFLIAIVGGAFIGVSLSRSTY